MKNKNMTNTLLAIGTELVEPPALKIHGSLFTIPFKRVTLWATNHVVPKKEILGEVLKEMDSGCF